MEFLNKTAIKLDKEINELDRFVFKFLKVLEKHTDYVIVSGYVAIILGRNRGTDDVDIIIPRMELNKFTLLYDSLLKNKFWCLNSSNTNDLYGLLTSRHSIRFAIEPEVSPNVELKFSKDIYDGIALKNPIKILINNKVLHTSFLELQIAYKEEVLKSNKDLEDAKHLRDIAKNYLNNELITEYKKKLREK